jgi:hypothetical protein
MADSSAIDEAVEKAIAEGNAVSEISTGWTKTRKVVHMKEPLSDRLRALLSGDARLRAWSINPTPHNKAEEGFTDDKEKRAIVFPK